MPRPDDAFTSEPPKGNTELSEERPTGVGAVAALFGLLALAGVLSGIGALWLALVPDAGPRGGAYALLTALAILALSLVAAGVAYGLWNRYRSAWGLAIFLSILGIVVGVGGIFLGEIVENFVMVAVLGLVTWYLLTPHVRAWFEAGEVMPDRAGRPA